MKPRIYEVVKEYRVSVENLIINARIIKAVEDENVDEERYLWEISHYCKQEANAIDVYIPDSNWSDSLEGVKYRLMSYLRAFTTKYKVIPNKSY